MAKNSSLPYNQFMAVKVSIIIVTYNSENYIEKLLKSIFDFNSDSDFEIIIIDNNSKDDSVEKLKKIQQNTRVQSKDTPKVSVRIIENSENFGFSKGINIGAGEAMGEYLLIINPDTEWKSGSVGDFGSVFENDTSVGAIGGKILTKDGNAEKSAGRFLKTSEVFFTTLGLDETLGVRYSPNTRQEVDFVSGGFVAVRRDLFERLGGFDENLFIYVEDMEFCFRVKKEGFKVLFDPSTEIIHESHGSSNRSFAIQNIYKGILYFHKKHGSPLSYLMVKSMLMTKAGLLVLIGKIMNNKYLINTYSELYKI